MTVMRNKMVRKKNDLENTYFTLGMSTNIGVMVRNCGTYVYLYLG